MPRCVKAIVVLVFLLAIPRAVLAQATASIVGTAKDASGAVLLHLVLMVKMIFFLWVFIWVRWTLPRFRYDSCAYVLPKL